MKIDDVTVRFLTSDDVDIFRDLIKDQKSIFGVDIKHFETYASPDHAATFILNHELLKTTGAFYEGKLIGITTGAFPDTVKTWWSTHIYLNTGVDSLINFKTSGLVFYKLMVEMQKYAESNGYYSFYIHRTLEHQKSIDKLFKYGEERLGMEMRYDCYYDYLYEANEKSVTKNHDPLFKGKTFPVQTVICLYMLKQEIRKKYLGI